MSCQPIRLGLGALPSGGKVIGKMGRQGLSSREDRLDNVDLAQLNVRLVALESSRIIQNIESTFKTVGGMERLSLGGFLPRDEGFSTRAIHAGQDPDDHSFGPIVAPLYASVNFKQDGPNQNRGYIYSRNGNPTRTYMETVLAALEQAQHAVSFSSGVGAAAAVAELLTVGDHLLCGDDLFGGTTKCFEEIVRNHGIDTSSADTTDIGALIKAVKPNTKMLFIESPTNPLMKVTDIPRVKETLNGINPDVILVVDNTFLTPYFQKPLQLGADVALYSVTKYLNGHSDVVMGAVTTDRDDIFRKMSLFQKVGGVMPAAYDCYMVVRSFKTLAIRLEQHMRNAMEVAEYLESHPLIERVLFPGLKSHPHHEIAKKMTSGVSGLMSVYVKGDHDFGCRFIGNLKCFANAGSLGGHESLVVMPWIMTHAYLPVEMRLKLGITPNLIRVSVGLESVKDLIADLDQALKAASLPDRE